MSVFIHPAHLMLKGVEETTGLLKVTGLLPVLNKSIFSCWLHSLAVHKIYKQKKEGALGGAKAQADLCFLSEVCQAQTVTEPLHV